MQSRSIPFNGKCGAVSLALPLRNRSGMIVVNIAHRH
jgi:hypothetical protein